MIQRPQTLLMLAVVILMSATAFSPIWSYESETISVFLNTQTITVLPSNETTSSIYLMYLAMASAVLAMFNIFQYKNRKLQMILGAVNNILITGFLLVVAFIALPKALELGKIQESGAFSLTFYLPVAAIFANFVSSKLIKKDDELVRSADRMR